MEMFLGKHNAISAVLCMQNGSRPPIDLPPPLAGYTPLIEACWRQDPSLRPESMSTVVKQLEQLEMPPTLVGA